MRMFLSVSGNSSELSIAKQSSRPIVSQAKMCFRHYIKLIWESPVTEDNDTVIYVPFIQNSNQMASRLTETTSFPRAFVHSCNFQGNFQAFWLTGLLWWQKLTWFFPAFSSRFLNFAVQFCFLYKFEFHEERRTSQVWQWRDFPRPSQFFATH